MKTQNFFKKLRNTWKVFFGRGIITKISFFIILGFVLLAIFAPLFCQDPLEIDLVHKYNNPSGEHILGTDSFGRDIFSRLIYGTRVSLLASLASALLAALIGITLGLIAGYFEHFAGAVIMRLVDAQLSIPPLIFSMIICAILGSGIWQTVVAIAIGMIPTYVRMIQGMVLTLKGKRLCGSFLFDRPEEPHHPDPPPAAQLLSFHYRAFHHEPWQCYFVRSRSQLCGSRHRIP